jgi:hypothetical protein
MSGIVASKDKLPEIINTVIGAVQAGELDARLKAAADASPIRKAKANKKK